MTLTAPAGQLSTHFGADEFRCRCGCGQLIIDTRLVGALETLRVTLNRPIRVNSGYRCPAHNEAVGGSPKSQHVEGTAADIVITGYAPDVVARYASAIPAFRNGGIGIYDTFTHLDVRENGPARWDYRQKA